jgi:Pyrimidine dimer DNA glycosylase
MQTFLPYPDFFESARVLDRQRLGKQRVETLQILQALTPDSESKWQRHPAVKMWRGYELALATYGVTICLEWRERGYRDTCLYKICGVVRDHFTRKSPRVENPPWLGWDEFHLSHRSNLVRKAPDHYRPLFEPDLTADLEYIWPAS